MRHSLPEVIPNQDGIFDAAGITKEERYGLLRHAVSRTAEALDATITKVFHHQGEVYYAKPLIDHATRLTASKQAALFAGISDRNTAPPPIHLTVMLPDWCFGRPPIDVTDAATASIEAHAAPSMLTSSPLIHAHATPRPSSMPLPIATIPVGINVADMTSLT